MAYTLFVNLQKHVLFLPGFPTASSPNYTGVFSDLNRMLFAPASVVHTLEFLPADNKLKSVPHTLSVPLKVPQTLDSILFKWSYSKRPQ